MTARQTKIIDGFLEKEKPFLLFAKYGIEKNHEAQSRVAANLLQCKVDSRPKGESMRQLENDAASRALVQQTEIFKLPTALQGQALEDRPADIGRVEGFSFVKIKHPQS
mmetsp:Transcript_17402/g.26816  ORF Transcript_17402/g.26816 Transcript_17402/m.26816 type:complete len:109 (-) Transcript_17402:9-335(-)